MSVLLPEIDDAVASSRLHNLQLALRELEIHLDELSTRRRIFQDKRTYLLESQNLSSHRSGLIAFQQTSIREKPRPGSGSDLSKTNKVLQSIDSQLAIMLQRHRRLSFSLEIYREILAPISHVPYEILQQIFRHTVPPGFVTPSINQAPLLLTMVCRKWRSIALSTPSLWSSISTTSDWPLQVFLPQPSLSNIDKFFRSLFRRPYLMLPSQPLLWIERARNAPLHMEITIPKKDYWFGTTDPYYHWVVQTSERWYHLRLSARSINLALLLSKPMPKLRVLELIGVYDRNYDFFMLRTYHAEFDLHPETFSFPWSSLTTLEASETWFIVDQLVAILDGSPNLQSCNVKIQDLYTIHHLPYAIKSQVIHPSLATLFISMNDRESYALRRLLDSLSLPSLFTLNITTLKKIMRSDWPHTAFISFLKRSSCPLRTLYLSGFSMLSRADTRWRDAGQITEIWSHLPLLEAFEFL